MVILKVILFQNMIRGLLVCEGLNILHDKEYPNLNAFFKLWNEYFTAISI